MDIGDIEGDESEGHESDTEYPGIENNNHHNIRESKLIDSKLINDNYNRENWRNKSDSESQNSNKFEGKDRKSKKIIHRKSKKLSVSVTRRTSDTFFRIKNERKLWISHPIQ